MGISASAAPGNYTAEYCVSETVKNPGLDNEVDTFHLLVAGFTVVATPPTLPPAGTPAFSWQGSVAGVNTGNGNKTTVLPITGWTMRGGMGVSCSLYHNSQGPNYVSWGNKWTPSYFSYFTADASGNLTVHWDNGLSYTFTKSGSTYTPPIGILDQVSTTASATVLTTINNTVYTFGFIPAHGQPGYGLAYLSSITDMDGNTLAIGHNTDTTLSAVTDANVTGVPSRILTYAYSGGQLSTITDPLARVWTFNYGTAGGSSSSNLADVILPTLNDGKTYGIYFGYDGNSNINAMQSAQGRFTGATSTFFYNSNNSLAWAKDPAGNETTFAYNSTNTVVTDPNGNQTTYTYTHSQLSSVTDAKGYSTLFNYDVDNILDSTQDKNSVANNLGYVWSNSSHFTNGTSTSTSEDPLGYYTSTTYDAKNKVTQSADAVGNITNNVYSPNSMEDLTSTSVIGTGTAPFKSSSSISGYSNGLPTTFTDPLKNQSSVGYDGYGNVNSTIDAAQDPAATAIYNALGWKTSSTDSNGHTTTYTPDNWGRIITVTAPDKTQTNTTYDADGNVLTVTDANTHTVTNIYNDPDERLTQTTNGRGDVVKYTYDGQNGYGSADMNGLTQKGLLSAKTDGNGHTTLYTYTVRNEPFQTIYPDGTGESIWYDPNGNVTSRQKSDYSYIYYKYDYDNRLTDITYPHLHATHFDYDGDGRKIDMTDATGETYWYYTYDGIHENQQTTPQGTVYYTYDGDGRRYQLSVNTPAVGQSAPWTYGYDVDSRLQTLQNPYGETTTLSYDPASRLNQQTNGDGTYSKFAYDVADQETDIYYYTSTNGLLGHLVYGYDLAGNIQGLTQNSNVVTTYGYDGADQLTSEVHTGDASAYSLGFTYDKNGNRLTQTSGGSVVQSFTYNAHDVLAGTGGESEGYDLNGNLLTQTVSGQQTTYVWDDEDRLTSITTPSGTSTFSYNGLGLRVGKTDSTGTYAYVCDGTAPASPVLADGSAVYTPGLSDHRGNASTFSHDDFLGNLRFLTNSQQGVTANLLPDAFGETVTAATAGVDATPFGWNADSGYQSDADGLKLLGHRYYDPRIGRFINQDPARMGRNWYAYVGNNPVTRTDPMGLWINSPFPVDGDPDNDTLITDAVDKGALPGEEYDLRQGSATGPIIKTFTIPAGNVFSFGGANILFPSGVNINRNIRAAKSFMASNASKSVYHYGWHGTQAGLKYDVNKIAAWLISNVDTGMGQDYKTLGQVYDASGHVNYAAVATELGFDMDSIIAGQQFVHLEAHGLGSGLEPTGNEFLGQQYDQQVFNPGPARFDVGDAFSAFTNYKLGL